MSESFSKGINYRHIRWNFHKLKTKKKNLTSSQKKMTHGLQWNLNLMILDFLSEIMVKNGNFSRVENKRVWAWILYSKLFRKEGENKDVLRKRNYENYLNGNKGNSPNRK